MWFFNVCSPPCRPAVNGTSTVITTLLVLSTTDRVQTASCIEQILDQTLWLVQTAQICFLLQVNLQLTNSLLPSA